MGSKFSKSDSTNHLNNNSKLSNINVKTVHVGDGTVGKTSMLITHTEKRFPVDYVPTVFDNYTTFVKYEENTFNLAFWDTAGEEEYSRLRALSYPETDVFIVCYSVVSRPSYENIKVKWIPEIKHHCPNAAYIIVGTKIDLRDDKETTESINNDILTFNDGIELAHEVKSIGYVECSSLTQEGLQQVFDEICKYIIEREIHKDDKDYKIKDYFINVNSINAKKAKSAYK